MTIQFRHFEIADYEDAKSLWLRTPGLGLSEADERASIEAFLCRNPGCSFVAHFEERLVGTVLCGHDGRRGLIHHLVTAPEQRRKGVGRGLLAHGLAALRAQGIGKCHLLVFKDNQAGIAFWHSMAAVARSELVLMSMPTHEDGALGASR